MYFDNILVHVFLAFLFVTLVSVYIYACVSEPMFIPLKISGPVFVYLTLFILDQLVKKQKEKGEGKYCRERWGELDVWGRC